MIRLLATALLLSSSLLAQAQQPFSAAGYIGIPKDGKVTFYYQLKEEGKEQASWVAQSEFTIPAGAIDLAGNQRKLIVLYQDSAAFYDNEKEQGKWQHRATFVFPPSFKLNRHNWIRNPYSTEYNISYMDGNYEKGYGRDGDTWYNPDSTFMKGRQYEAPLIPMGKYDYLFEYQLNNLALAQVTATKVAFSVPSRYMLGMVKAQVPEKEVKAYVDMLTKMTFTLPPGARHVFVHDWDEVCVVMDNSIEFWRYNAKAGSWLKNEQRTLKF